MLINKKIIRNYLIAVNNVIITDITYGLHAQIMTSCKIFTQKKIFSGFNKEQEIKFYGSKFQRF